MRKSKAAAALIALAAAFLAASPARTATDCIGCHDQATPLVVMDWRTGRHAAEGIELAKKIGATDGHKFVNAVLDRAARQLRSSEQAASARERA